MTRWFNTAGPCRPELHFMVPVERRLPDLRRVIEQQAYFVLHAPRQVGKTTSLMSFAKELTIEGRYSAVLVSAEVGAAFPREVGAAENAILAAWRSDADARLPPDLQPPPWPAAAAGHRIRSALSAWSAASPRPLVLFIDEIDALRDDVLVSVLRQLRGGYPDRPHKFPHALGLIGLRDVRDYKVASGGSDRLGTASPFNVKLESFTLRDFTAGEVEALYAQHTEETGQTFTPPAVARAFELTQGQPWLVNALARQLTEVVVPGATRAIEASDVDEAKEILIRRNRGGWTRDRESDLSRSDPHRAP